MWKVVKGILLLVIIVLPIYLWYSLPVITGYGAKVMCSAVFVSHRNVEGVLREELGSVPFNLGKYILNYSDSSVTATVFGFAKKKAVYRTGLGSTLINDVDEKDLRSFKPRLYSLYDSLDVRKKWPDGEVIADTNFSSINYPLIDSSLKYCFSDTQDSLRRTRAVIVLYKGKIIRERYARGYDSSSVLPGWSMAKSVTNAMLGILVKTGRLRLNDSGLFKEWKGDERNKITLADLMHMSSGLRWWEFYAGPSDVTTMLFKKGDMGGFAVTHSFNFKPDERFYYSSGTANVLSLKIREVVGDSDYYRFAARELFSKIGMHHAILEADASGTFVGSSYCYSTARDWARFGLLYLHDGVWNGDRILPEGWVSFSTHETVAPSDMKAGKFGALFWLNVSGRYPHVPAGCFSAMGYEGQSIWIIPSKDLVVVRLSCEHGNVLDADKFLGMIVKGLGG